MIKRNSHARASINEKQKSTTITRNDCGTDFRSREKSESGGHLPSRKHPAQSVFEVEDKVQGGRNSGFAANEEGSKTSTRSETLGIAKRVRASEVGVCGAECGAPITQKKRELGLYGNLRSKHLSKPIRDALIVEIKAAIAKGETVLAICKTLEISTRSYYRWVSGQTSKDVHGGGGGKNKITPLEEKRVVAFAEKHPDYRCRRIAYALEQQSIVFIGKTKVAEILKKHGLNYVFIKNQKDPKPVPSEVLCHEPWKKNLLWGTDWTYFKIAGRFWFLLLIIDWYSRKILSFGIFPENTKFHVVAVITEAVANERIDELQGNELKPRIVADHGSANIAKYTKTNIEVQGLELWLSGIGRPTGNARTERVMGTLKREEIDLQEEYESEEEAKKRITFMIHDYNLNRPNQGNGGFAPNSVHTIGRHVLAERRKRARQFTQNQRRKHWTQEFENGSPEPI